MAQRSWDGIGTPRAQQSAIEHAALIWTRPANTIRARGIPRPQQRPDRCQHPTARHAQPKTLLRKGAVTDVAELGLKVRLPLPPPALCNAHRLGRAELGETVEKGGADLKLGGLAVGGSG